MPSLLLGWIEQPGAESVEPFSLGVAGADAVEPFDIVGLDAGAENVEMFWIIGVAGASTVEPFDIASDGGATATSVEPFWISSGSDAVPLDEYDLGDGDSVAANPAPAYGWWAPDTDAFEDLGTIVTD